MSDLLAAVTGGALDVGGVVLRVAHTGAAALAAGGVVFQMLALHPTLVGLPAETRLGIRESVVARWRITVFSVIGLLLVSGLINFVAYKLPEFRGAANAGLYHGLFGLKFLAALLAFHGATVLALPGKKGEAYRNGAAFWLRYLTVLFAVVFVLGAVLRGITPVFGE